MHVIQVSSPYASVLHGPWRDQELAESTAEQWNRVFAKRGWPLRATVQGMLDKSAGTRDRLGALLVDLAERSRQDEQLRLDCVPCECPGLNVVPGSANDAQPDGMCFCGHEPGEHDGEEQCDGMVLPPSVAKATGRGRRQCVRCARSGGELSENGCPSCGPDAEIRWVPEAVGSRG